MLEVKFYTDVNREDLKFVVIISQYEDKWVLCKHKERSTYEFPGGHIECGESVEDAARRELWEETGAKSFELTPICVYSVQGNDGVVVNQEETFGMLFYAKINSFGELPAYEMDHIELLEELPHDWTYPEIQPKLFDKLNEVMK